MVQFVGAVVCCPVYESGTVRRIRVVFGVGIVDPVIDTVTVAVVGFVKITGGLGAPDTYAQLYVATPRRFVSDVFIVVIVCAVPFQVDCAVDGIVTCSGAARFISIPADILTKIPRD